jgi:hypothetical protein
VCGLWEVAGVGGRACGVEVEGGAVAGGVGALRWDGG